MRYPLDAIADGTEGNIHFRKQSCKCLHQSTVVASIVKCEFTELSFVFQSMFIYG